ncbi:MAG: hypothetical protein IJS27_02125 [Ruminococcus sp.]|nr:hypothetical protein [Ruminococcus sp.]MBQ9515358.1 hypothetical protein [Ruminococcus sp.]
MITAFHIMDNTRTGVGALLSLFRRNRIRVEHRYCDAVAVTSIVYELHRGKVTWASVDRFAGDQRAALLCREGISLPSDRGYRRFVSDELRIRLCENAALYLLNNCTYPVRVALIDDSGDHAGLCRYLAESTDRVTVVTGKTRLYLDEADRLLQEKGAVISVTKGISALKNADLIIAPARLEGDLHCADNAVILSAAEPTVAQNAPVIHDYSFDLPRKFSELKPDYLDDMYFASALYTLAGAHELGSSVFRRCTDGRTIHTRKSLTEQLKKRLQAVQKS